MKRKLIRRFRTIQLVANLTGVAACSTYFIYFDDIRPILVDVVEYLLILVVVTCLLCILGFGINFSLQRPVMQYIALRASGRTPSFSATHRAQQRLLNTPLIAGLVGLTNWSLAAVVVPLILIYLAPPSGAGETLLHFSWIFVGIFLSGLVTSVLVFFSQEISIRSLLLDFFPDGGVAKVHGVFRINLRRRVLLFFLLGGLFPMMDMAFLAYNKARLVLIRDPQQVLDELLALLTFTLLLEGCLAFVLARFLTKSIIDPVHRLQEAMNRVAAGDLAARARLHDNNELGQLGDHFNRMTTDLEERFELRRTIALAREVQQTLLPSHAPQVVGLEIAGKSFYCDATGGDYWDYLLPETMDEGIVSIAVGDVSGHGLPAALLMASVRASLRQRVAMGGDIGAVLTDVNRQFSRDAETSGHFMTLFYLSIDRQAGRLEWVRAGHDPAMLYDPLGDSMEDLKGRGVALGVDADAVYIASKRDSLRVGQVLLIGTDGIWEACNLSNEMLGKQKVRERLREQAHCSASEIVASLTELVHSFVGEGRLEDDLTMVVVKIVD